MLSKARVVNGRHMLEPRARGVRHARLSRAVAHDTIFVSTGVKFGCFSQQKGAQDACGVHQGRRRAPKLSQDVLYGSSMHWAGRCSLELHTVQDETTNSSIISVKYGVRAAPKLATVCFKQSEGCQCVANAGATC